MKVVLATVVATAAAALTVASSESGKVEEFGGLSTYISGPADAKAAVILVSDVFGYEPPHLREIADKVGGAGFYGVAPDFFRGSPFVREGGGNISSWLIDHSTEKGFEDAKAVVEALKSKGITKIGGVGFCWGGSVVVKLLTPPLIETGVLIHPSLTTVADIQGIKAPVSILAGEKDTATPVELIRQFETALKAKPEVESWVKIFPGQPHGWALRYDGGNASAVKSAEEAHKDMLEWLHTHLTA